MRLHLAIILAAATALSATAGCSGGNTSAAAVSQPCAVDGDCPTNTTCVNGFCGAGSGISSSGGPSFSADAGQGGFSDGAASSSGGAGASGGGADPCAGGTCCKTEIDCEDRACKTRMCVGGRCAWPQKALAECECFSTADCDDGNSCTAQKCLSFACSYERYLNPENPTDLTDPDDPTQRCCADAGECGATEGQWAECLQHRCVFHKLVTCKADGDCDDGNACTVGRCDAADGNGKCVFDAKDGCCTSNSDCNDGSACSADTCKDGICSYASAGGAGCCAVPKDCDDGLGCTADACDAKFQCKYAVIGKGCCNDVDDCDDDKKCTVDTCTDHKCSNVMPPEGCCKKDADCDDGDPCATAACVAGDCKFTTVKGCCKSATDCEDGDKCTNDACVNGKCSFSSNGQCCSNNAQCEDGNKCTTDSCNGGLCKHEQIAGCTVGGGSSGSSGGSSGGGGTQSCQGKCEQFDPTMLCSCQSFCDLLGNCCQDYKSVCSTSSGSCKGKCGDPIVGSCSCSSGCELFGSCCGDYKTECAGGGSSGGGTSGSCKGKCGDFSAGASCQCDTGCASAQDCCSDYATQCGGGGSSGGAVCSGGINSCKDQCGKFDAFASCQCDVGCKSAGDCCSDLGACCP